jgi:hypothetical protein
LSNDDYPIDYGRDYVRDDNGNVYHEHDGAGHYHNRDLLNHVHHGDDGVGGPANYNAKPKPDVIRSYDTDVPIRDNYKDLQYHRGFINGWSAAIKFIEDRVEAGEAGVHGARERGPSGCCCSCYAHAR